MSKEMSTLAEMTIYRCPVKCPIQKKCFVLKTEKALKKPIAIYYKCKAHKRDIRIEIGEKMP